MSRCFYKELEADNITFLPEGLFDNLINLKVLWVNTSLFSLSNKLKRLSPKETTDQPEVFGRTQGLKTSNSEVKFICRCQISLHVLFKAVIFSRTLVLTANLNESINKKAYSDESMFSRDTAR